MALARRNRRQDNIWPGFVDALATLLMVIIFLLMIFVLAQFFLSETLSGRESALDRLNQQVAEMADLLALERASSEDLRANLSQISAQLQASVQRGDDLQTRLRGSEEQLSQAVQSLASAQEASEEQKNHLGDLAREIQALEALRDELRQEIAQKAAALDESETALLNEQELSESARAQVALMNQAMEALQVQLAELGSLLEEAERKNAEQEVQIANLGSRLNAALATKVQELNRYRSEFFGALRQVLGNQQGIRVVGDRFVFQSEVLFGSGSAILGAAGQDQMTQLAGTLQAIAAKIPDNIDWVLRVDGHTDNVPIATARFPSNWELSSARAISVVQHLIANGVPANRLVAAGFGEFQPLDAQDDEIAKRRNRRIELKLTQR